VWYIYASPLRISRDFMNQGAKTNAKTGSALRWFARINPPWGIGIFEQF